MEYKVVLNEEDIKKMLYQVFESDADIKAFWKVIEEDNGIMGSYETLQITLVSDAPITQGFDF